jgi:capsular exopolysaccharide synthesis family protein
MSDSAQATADDSAYIGQLWRTLLKNRWLIAAIFAGVLAAVTFFTLGQRRIYQAVATIEIDPTPPSPLGHDVPAIVQLGDAFWNNQEYYATQYKIIASRGTAEAAVRTLGLNHDGAFLDNLPADQRHPANASVEAAAAAVLGRFRVDPVKESRLVTLTFEDADPTRARKVLAAIIDSYLQRNIDEAVSSNNSAGDWLKDQLITLKKDLESSEIALHAYKAEKQILSVSMDEQSNMLREEMQRLNQALTDVRTQREHLSSRVRELQKVNSDDPVNLPATELLDNTLLSTLRSTYIEAKGELSALVGAGRGPNHPETKAAEAHLANAREALVGEIRNVRGAQEGNLAAAAHEEAGLSHLFEMAKQRAMDLNLLEIEYHRLERTKTNNEKLYGVVLERSKESDLAGMMRFNNIRVVEEPLESKSAIKPRIPLNLALGAIGGLFLGLMAAVGKEQLDRSIKSAEDLERELGLPFLGTLPFTSKDPAPGSKEPAALDVSPELLVHAQPAGGLAEAARGIRTNLMFMSPDRPYQRILVTSAVPGEGKTTVASAIAVAMAQAAQRVLLMDCDLRRPRLHRIYNKVNDVGVTSLTMNPLLLEHSSLSTQVPNLDLLPAGPMVPNPAEFLHSAAFASMLRKLAESYDRIVIDSPPASIVSDSAILATQADGVVFVVRASSTPRETARKALKSLRDVSAHMIGSVLNAFDFKRLGYGYYYKPYSYYRSDDEPAVNPPPAS